MASLLRSLVPLALITTLGCDRHEPPRARRTAAAPPSPSASAASASSAPSDAPPLTAREFSALVTSLSEPDHEFFSDNLVSNETSYLQPARELAARPAGGAYLGVGPEQNFTYIALTRPSLAFIVDIRRGNLLLQLLYKSIFDEASSRSQFLTLLLGRPYVADGDPGAAAGIDAVIRHAESHAPDETEFTSTHARLVSRIRDDYLVPLDAKDEKRLMAFHRAFFEHQLDIAFELVPEAKKKSARKYPSLDALLPGGFLATEASFRTVQRLERDNRVIPVVGDFGGEHAMRGVARELGTRGLTLNVFYVSNVEQYLFDDTVWPRWIANLRALPHSPTSAVLRVYLDQGRPHPLQQPGERSTSLLRPLEPFLTRQEKAPFRSFWDVVTWTP